jgi:pilus assembly protein Flp/PilA
LHLSEQRERLAVVLNQNKCDLRRLKMTKIFARLMKDESGATAIEYGLIATLIAVAIISGATAVGTNLNSKFHTIATNIGT